MEQIPIRDVKDSFRKLEMQQSGRRIVNVRIRQIKVLLVTKRFSEGSIIRIQSVKKTE